MERWWVYWRRRKELLDAIDDLQRVIAIARHSSVGLPLLVPTNQVLSEALVVFATDRHSYLAMLSSSAHFAWWTTKGESSIRSDARYTPSDGFETFPQPELTERMELVGGELDSYRRSVMLARELGLTKLYNLVHDPRVSDMEVRRLREIHVEIDEAVAEAYGWSDLVLGHGFHHTRQGKRFSIEPAVQVEVLDRLLDLNRARYAEERDKGLHSGTRSRPKKAKAATRTRASEGSTPAAPAVDDGLFPLPDALF